MLSSVPRSPRAVETMRAFVRLRRLMEVEAIAGELRRADA